MPNRMVRDWTDSDKVNLLSAQAERFFLRLIMKADDFGCYYGNPRLLKSNLFPLTEGLRDTDISRWTDECQKAGLIAVYEAAGKRYLEILDFRQRLRMKKRKFPVPPVTDKRQTDDGHMPAQCPPEGEVEVETEEEVEGEGPPVFNPAADSTVIYDIESYLLNNQIAFEQICVSAKKNESAAKISLTKYHLWNQENEKYPKSKLSLVSGFKRWLMNEKEDYGTHKQVPPAKNGTSQARTDALKNWGLASGEQVP